MLPDPPDFLSRWAALAEGENSPVAFGGFTLDQTPLRPEHAVHRAMALKGDCTAAPERAREPEKHVFTSNLLVRRDVFEAIDFDEGFTGWGWEDVEWAMRVGQLYPILHIDNSASHLGLDTAPDRGRQVRAVGRQLRPGGRHPSRHRQRLSQLQGRQACSSACRCGRPGGRC
jgi:hypothetical protein